MIIINDRDKGKYVNKKEYYLREIGKIRDRKVI